MNVLVAGASGVIGREVVDLLCEAGDRVRTLSRDPERAKLLQARASDVRVLDATVDGALSGVCDGIDVVVSALGAPVRPGAAGKQPYASVDLEANRRLLAEAARAKVRRFVYVGVFTTDAYENTAYVRAHAEVEALVKKSGLAYGFVRTTGVFGALAELIPMARKGPVPLIGDGSATTNPVHERDVAEAVVEAVRAESSLERDLGGPEVLTRRRIAELALIACGKPLRLLALPVPLMRVIAWFYGLFNRRMAELLRFVILASTHPCVAPTRGMRSLGPYFEALAKRGPGS